MKKESKYNLTLTFMVYEFVSKDGKFKAKIDLEYDTKDKETYFLGARYDFGEKMYGLKEWDYLKELYDVIQHIVKENKAICKSHKNTTPIF
jgi:hypothetical protein